MNVNSVNNMYNLTVEYFANDTKIVRNMQFCRLFAADSPSVGDKVTLCYSPNDTDDIAVENGKLTCAPPDPITFVAVYIAHTFKFVAAFCAVSLALLVCSFPIVPIVILLLVTSIYIVVLGFTGDPGAALFWVSVWGSIIVIPVSALCLAITIEKSTTQI